MSETSASARTGEEEGLPRETAGPEAIATAVAAARAAQRAWREVPLRQRAAIVGRVRTAVFDRREEIAEIVRRETGKPSLEALLEAMLVADTAAWISKHAPAVLRSVRSRSMEVMTLRKSIEVRWIPFGVIGIISPWNYPLLIPAASLLAAIAGGNGVVLKPSELTPRCGEVLVELVRAAGVPADLVHCIAGDGRAGRHLIESGIDRLFFTGSSETGRKVAAACGERLIPCSLELGGSDAAIVLEDADPVRAARGIVWGRFSNAGQTCVAPKRLFAVGAIHDRLIDEIARAVLALRVGSAGDCDVGPLIHPRQAETLRAQRNDALERGAKVVARVEPQPASPSAVAVEVLADANVSMRVMREETFGPLLPVVRVGTADEAVALANESPYGLSASVWTRDVRKGLSIARRLEAGTVMINDVLVAAAMPEVAHGGVKASGTGRIHGSIGLLQVVQAQTIVIDPFAGWSQPWWFPYTNRMLEGIRAFFHFRHGRGWLSRLRAGIRAVRLLLFR